MTHLASTLAIAAVLAWLFYHAMLEIQFSQALRARIELLERRVNQLERQSHDWEQKYRECQASLWMRDPTWLTNSAPSTETNPIRPAIR